MILSKPPESRETVENRNANELQQLLGITDEEISKAKTQTSFYENIVKMEKENNMAITLHKYINQEEREMKKEQIKEIQVTVYHCLKCEYIYIFIFIMNSTWLEKPSEFCITLKHTISQSQGVKRFFKCSECGKKKTTLNNFYPSGECCKNSSWVRCGMGNLDIGYDNRKDQLKVNGDDVRSHINGYYIS